MPIDFGSNSSGGGGGGYEYIPPPLPEKRSGPFINWRSPASVLTAPIRGTAAAAKDVGELAVQAGKGIAGTGQAVGEELWHDVTHPSLQPKTAFELPNKGAGGIDLSPESVEQFSKTRPFTGALIGSNIRTAQDVGQVARAGVNTLTPGQPFAGVGQLGSGAGLLGSTELAHSAERGGGGVLPKLIEDAANASAITAPVSGLVGLAADDAVAAATARGAELTAAEQAAKQASKAAADTVTQASERATAAEAAVEQARTAASQGDPVAGAQMVTQSNEARAAQESLRQAKEYEAQVSAEHEGHVSTAQALADDAEAKATRFKEHAKTAKLVHNLGIKAANSPFAAGGLAVDKAIAPALHAIIGTGPGQAVFDRASALAAQIAEHAPKVPVGMTAEGRAQKHLTQHTLEEGRNKTAEETASLRRGYEATSRPTNTPGEPRRSIMHPLKGGRTGEVADPDAQTVTIMAQTGEGAQLRQLLVRDERGQGLSRKQALDVFDEATTRNGVHQYTREQLELAADVFGPAGPATGRAAEIRDAIPQVREAYASGPEVQQAENYRRLRGESEPIMGGVGEGALAQAEHNLDGTGANIDQLSQWHSAQKLHEQRRGRLVKASERAGKTLATSTERLEGTHVSTEEFEHPRQLLNRVLTPARDAARNALTGGRIAELTAEGVEPAVRKIAQGVIDGKLNLEDATKNLTAQIVKYASRQTASVSDVMRSMIDEAGQRGMGEVPRGIPSLATATKPAELLGGGRERLRAGTAEYNRAVAELAKGGDVFDRAQAKLREGNRPATAGQVSASKRLVAATSKLRELQAKVDAAATPEAAADVEAVSVKDAEAVVHEVRAAAKQWHQAQAKAISDELNDASVKGINPTPPRHTEYVDVRNKSGNKFAGARRAAQVPDWGNGGWDFASHVFRELDPKFKAWAERNGYFETGEGRGLSPEEAVEQWGSVAHGKTEDPARTMEEWLAKVQDAYNHTIAARSATAKAAGSYDAIAHAIDAQYGGQEPLAHALAEHIGTGAAKNAAQGVREVLQQMREREGAAATPEARLQPGGDVHAALEADRQAEQERGIHGAAQDARAALDEQGQTIYDRQVAEDQLGVQDEHVVPQREAQLQRASERASQPGRNQGRAEGRLLGRASEQIRQGEQMATRGDTAAKQGAAVMGKATEHSAETVARVAGPVGELYGRVGAAQADVLRATRAYELSIRAVERLDERLADKQRKLMASIDAQPRPMRPVLEVGRRIAEVLQPMADQLDRDIGDGAGDVYRASAAEATITADELRRAGIDPQFIIGNRERVPSSVNRDVARATATEELPVAGSTGQRKASRGLFHPTTYPELYDRDARRATQIIKNETAQKIIDAVGGNLGDILERRMGASREQLAEMSREELIGAMHDNGLSPWDVSDGRGRTLPGAQINLDTPVVPTHVWRTYSPYIKDSFKGGAVLHAYDTLQRHWKASVLYLTGRWHTSQIIGDAVMAMAGGGIRPDEYLQFRRVATRLERLRQGIGTAEDQAFVESHLTPGQAEGLGIKGGYTPGSVVDRGFSREEFGSGQLQPGQHGVLRHPIEAGWRLQSYLDNINRTTVWLAKLDKGLDRAGLEDFRSAYPQMAHLSDAEIKSEAAIRLAVRTMGDYSNMTAAERNIVKRIIPFYSFQRHITKLAFNLAVHDPVRVAWMLHLPTMFAGDDSDVDWLSSSYKVGSDRFFSPPRWNPFDAVTQWADPSNPFGGVSPLITVPTSLVTGFDPKRMKAISRAPGTPDGPILGVPGAPGYIIGNQIPQVKALREALPALLGHQAVARYGTGQPVLSGGLTIPVDQSQLPLTNRNLPRPLAPLFPLLGAGSQSRVDEQAIIDAQQRKNDSARKAAARYAQARAAAG